ncbi:MAG: Ribonuclease HI [Holosporales bacterium]
MTLEDFLKTATESLRIYTDGACSGNPGPGGWGAIFVKDRESFPYYGGDSATTNNRMEMLAVIEALSAVQKLTSLKKVTLYTDSRYVMDGITSWIAGWKKNNWLTSAKKPVKNQELWVQLDALTQALEIEWHWVKGHNGNKYNEMADTYARKGIISHHIRG